MNPHNSVIPPIRLSTFATERTVKLDSTAVVRILLLGYAVSLGMMALAHVLPSVLVVPFIVLALSFVPGGLFVVAVATDELRVDATHVLYAFGCSLVILMFVGALTNVLLPVIGVTKPLMPIPLATGVSLAVALLAGIAYWGNQSGSVAFRIPPLWSPIPLALLLLPLLAIIGVTVINAAGTNWLLLIVLLGIGVVPFLVVRGHLDRWHSLAIWTISLAILYHKSLWQYAGFGGRPHGIVAWEAGRWSPGVTSIDPYSTELLQNGVLFPLFARLSDLFIITQYEVVNPFFVSFLPLALYVAFRQYVETDIAFLGAALFAFAHPFYLQYPTAGRAAAPVIFFALFGVVLANKDLPAGSRAGLAVVFLVGIIVTHYGTSYYVAAALVVALVLLYSLRVVDGLQGGLLRQAVQIPDGGTAAVDRSGNTRRSTIFTTATVVFFISGALGWYLYTRQGWKFDLLPKHISENLRTLIEGATVSGRTTARVQESYTSMSIEVAKYIYILLALLILVGLLIVLYRRIWTNRCAFDDHYLSIATALFAIFGITIVFRNWGGGRPMMITFSFTSVFAVIATEWLGNVGRQVVEVVRRYLPSAKTITGSQDRVRDVQPVGAYTFATLLMVLFVLNTGVGAATVFGGNAPSKVPAQATITENQAPQSQVTVHREIDIVTHLWLVTHLDDRYPVYGDTYAARQFDWYRPDIAARSPALGGGYTAATKPQVYDVDRQRTGRQPGYILIVGHNLELDAVWPSKFNQSVPLANLSTEHRNRIYTNGESHIYFYSESTPAARAPTSSSGD